MAHASSFARYDVYFISCNSDQIYLELSFYIHRNDILERIIYR